MHMMMEMTGVPARPGHRACPTAAPRRPHPIGATAGIGVTGTGQPNGGYGAAGWPIQRADRQAGTDGRVADPAACLAGRSWLLMPAKGPAAGRGHGTGARDREEAGDSIEKPGQTREIQDIT